MQISNKLRKWRKVEDLSQSKAALRLGISKRTLENWEQGKRQPTGVSLTFLEMVLKVPGRR